MNPETQKRLVALAIGAGTLAYLGLTKPSKNRESKNGDIPESKLQSPHLDGIKHEMKEKVMGKTPVIQEKVTTKDIPKRS